MTTIAVRVMEPDGIADWSAPGLTVAEAISTVHVWRAGGLVCWMCRVPYEPSFDDPEDGDD